MIQQSVGFSVLMSVYYKENAIYFDEALDSNLSKQTLSPSEFVLVHNGDLTPELDAVIDKYKILYPDIFKVVYKEFGSFGEALRYGLTQCSYDLIARSDSDDICMPNRFELQTNYMIKHPELDIVGGQISEFINNHDNVVGKRIVPENNDDIYRYMKYRCGLNHMTVMFRKSSVLEVGNYVEWFWNEDYYLWIRMMMAKCVFANLPNIVVNARSGEGQYSRRGGKKYFESEKALKKLMYEKKLITYPEYVYCIVQRYILQVLMPNKLRGWIFRNFARSK